MHRMSQLIGICLVFLAGSTCASNAAINCEFQRLKQVHETLVFCSEQIDLASEARYAELTKEFQSFFSPDVNSKPAWDSIEEIRKRLVQEGKDRVCKDPGLSASRRDFFQYVSEAGMARVKNLLSQPRNRTGGDCY